MGAIGLQVKMYVTVALVFAVAFAVLYSLFLYMGFGSVIGIFAFAVLFFLLQWYLSPELMKWLSKLHYIGEKEYPELRAVVKELAETARVPMPRIAIAPRPDPNAYVFGRTVKSSTLVVHEGLLKILDKNELRAVLAHEMGHLRHNDVVMMTMVSFLPMVAYMVARSLLWGGMWGNNRNSSGGLIAVGFAGFVVYFIMQMLTLSLSRARESYADEYSAATTRKPEHLASSLLKITGVNYASGTPRGSTDALAFYISDPFSARKDVDGIIAHAKELKEMLPNLDVEAFAEAMKKQGASRGSFLMGLFATHPPAHKRVLRLAEIKKKGLVK